MVASSDIEVWDYNPVTNVRNYELTRWNITGVSLFNDQYSVDEERGILYFPPQMIGHTVQIVYFTEGDLNPFNTSGNLFSIINNVIQWTDNRIVDGIFLYREDTDEYYLQRIKEGSFVLNGNFYTLNMITIDFRIHGIPTARLLYRCVYLFINADIISSFLDNQTKELHNIGILISSGLWNSQGFAKTDVVSRYTAQYGDEKALPIAFVYILVDDSNNVLYWLEYPKESRLLSI